MNVNMKHPPAPPLPLLPLFHLRFCLSHIESARSVYSFGASPYLSWLRQDYKAHIGGHYLLGTVFPNTFRSQLMIYRRTAILTTTVIKLVMTLSWPCMQPK